ncbi:hypothetical protein F5Y13DRAFT_197892 [Hypoxylon sp. FL1857]|nr:hypothetical protein F5Y13DRAFT_197892 [Hypoxylon sp. FL1857]
MDEDTHVVVGAEMAVLSIIIIGMRFYARCYKKAGYRWDDCLIVTSLSTMIAIDILAICAISANPNGPEAVTEANDTSYEYSPEDVEYTKLSRITTVLYFSITATTKLSILLMYRRLFSFGCTIANLLNCIPIKCTWIDSLADPRYCFNYNYYWFASGICEAFLNFWIILMPIRELNRKQKIAVTTVFLLVLGYIPGSREPSFTRTQLWTSVHCGTGVICASIRPRLWHNISSSSVLGRSRVHKEITVHDLGWPSSTTVRGPRRKSNNSAAQLFAIPLRESNEESQPNHYGHHTSASFVSEMRLILCPFPNPSVVNAHLEAPRKTTLEESVRRCQRAGKQFSLCATL